MEYSDPNLRFAKRKIRLVYQMWQYTHEAFVTIGGNCRGNMVLEDAHETYMRELWEKNDGHYLIYFRNSSDTLEVGACASKYDNDEEEYAQDEFERDMEQCLVLIEIVEVC